MARATQRDREVLTEVNGHGFVTNQQWARLMNAGYSTAARRARLLIDEGLLGRVRLPLLAVSPLVPTKAACDLIGDDLAPITQVRLAEFEHDSTLVDLSISLAKRFAGTWIPERRLRQIFPDQAHIPDGLLRRRDGDIAIELELSCKAPRRLTEILATHAANLSVRETWYVTDNEAVAKLVRRLADGYPQIKIVRFNRKSRDG